LIENLINYIEQGLSKQRNGEDVFFAFPDVEAEYIIEALEYYKDIEKIG
jgi:uncharacterized protein (DUF433 family)